MIALIRAWFAGFDRCESGGHRMLSRSGYRICRGHSYRNR